MKSKGKVAFIAIAMLGTWLIPFPKLRKSSPEPNMIPEDDIPTDPYPPVSDSDDFRTRIVTIAQSQVGQPEQYKYAAAALGITEEQAKRQGTDKLAWCGLFVTWVLQHAGADINWELEKGICYRLPRTKTPKPGDIIYIAEPYQHHAIVEAVGAEMITSIDGNSKGGVVARRTRAIDEITAFYDVGPLDPDNRGLNT